jgi:hypothetical protein
MVASGLRERLKALESIASEKVILRLEFTATSLALLEGLVIRIVGAVVSVGLGWGSGSGMGGKLGLEPQAAKRMMVRTSAKKLPSCNMM